VSAEIPGKRFDYAPEKSGGLSYLDPANRRHPKLVTPQTRKVTKTM
jgi:hypothetical protein